MAIHTASMGLYGATWQARGYCGSGAVGEFLNALAGRTALICGNAAGVFDEVAEASALVEQPVVFAANDVGMYLPRLDHWVTLHEGNLKAWKAVRWLHQQQDEQVWVHSHQADPAVDVVWTGLTPLFSLSGYFAMQLAYLLGCERIILCGCPGDATRRFFDGPYPTRQLGYGNDGLRKQVMSEMYRLPEFKAAVRSMSGWTKEFFGSIDT